jgi:hypothetical protein
MVDVADVVAEVTVLLGVVDADDVSDVVAVLDTVDVAVLVIDVVTVVESVLEAVLDAEDVAEVVTVVVNEDDPVALTVVDAVELFVSVALELADEVSVELALLVPDDDCVDEGLVTAHATKSPAANWSIAEATDADVWPQLVAPDSCSRPPNAHVIVPGTPSGSPLWGPLISLTSVLSTLADLVPQPSRSDPGVWARTAIALEL